MRSIYESLSGNLKFSFSRIKLIVMDFDGTFTDNTIVHHADGTEAVVRSKYDSMGIDLLKEAGVYDKSNYENNGHKLDILIMSKEANPVVISVAQKVKIKCLPKLDTKIHTFKEEIKRRGLDSSQVLYMGNDINDIACIQEAGLGVAVNDAAEQVKAVADYVTTHKGGKGAFREVCELILYAQNKHPYS
ncbi:MAG: HAD hydrolase family protein [Candidatus Margulisbacteria bacterium]|nr:HAD hydrolase family protein [Candidatus Margulisiibacteriota bacterium]